MATTSPIEHFIDDDTGSEVSQNRRSADRVQDAVGLRITRLLDEPIQGDSKEMQGTLAEGDCYPTHKISLSSAGVAFAHDVLLRPGELILISITLFPSCHTVQADGRVVSANEAIEIADGDKPTYRVAFESISDSDRGAIEAQVKALVDQRPILD